MSSTVIAISAAANANAAVAQHQANQAAKAACEALMPAYTHAGASVDSMRIYASCVDRLYPHPMDTTEVLFWKMFIVFVFTGIVIGLLTQDDDGIVGRIMGGFVGGITAAGVCLVAGLLVFAIAFLFH